MPGNISEWEAELRRTRALHDSTRLPNKPDNAKMSARGPPDSPADHSGNLTVGSRADRVNALFEDYLTLSEAAEAIGVSERTLTRWHHMRVGPPRTRVGRKVLYHIPAARAWIAAQEEEVAKRGRGAV